MAMRGLCSRREADTLIKEGKVKVYGKPVDLKQSMFEEDVEIDIGDLETKQKNLITVLLNKPPGFVSSLPNRGEKPAIQLLTAENYHTFPQDPPTIIPRFLPKLAVVGRLDKDSRGLLVFTQDGRLAKELIGENTTVEKEYIVQVHGRITDEKINRLRHGMTLDGMLIKQLMETSISAIKKQ